MKEDNDYSINKAFIHSFDYILFSQCSLCSCFIFFAVFMAGKVNVHQSVVKTK